MKTKIIAAAVILFVPFISHGQNMTPADAAKWNHDEAVRIAQANAQAKQKEEAKNIAAMAKAPLGSEDSCHRDTNRAIMADPDYATLNCQFGGEVELADLKKAGWLVVNKTKGEYGFVTDYYIKKAR
ncbi:hypothetical protein [Burkholderia multivorans]|uniref:hypothetical protein n=1 Tax=Burkholderia multivorans TaxID=87883 RepID=UPI00158D8134|nr:hypothetical protein [Burkholderia multivorans]MCL4630006.1 hypothetical protein [Burkholderia multivorans]MCO1389228.1 hypothetical protein [Burkholderia multivorans]UQO10878.1 hypothetical protein L0Z40_12525 [Burkholderia multivorans]UQO57240.1 hypothetical protein L0Z30_12795 [Burkholderia multivorans]UQO60865.1 hypothetical protein L0Z29_03295 [Burkholderia multivorans]